MKKPIVVFGLGLVLFFLSAVISYVVFSKVGMSSSSGKGFGNIFNPLQATQQVKIQNKTSEEQVDKEPRTEACPLNGELFSKSQREKWEKRRPLGIMIENHTQARPQSGLSTADIVFETVAEGGITRFLSVYYCGDASYVGPVRSARIYFIHLLEGFGQYPLYAHVGGANTPGPADALGYINKVGWGSYNDLNQFAVPFPNYWRDYERLPNRDTEHTVYTSTSKLWSYASAQRKLTQVDEDGKRWDEELTLPTFAEDAVQSKRGDVKKISFSFWKNLKDDYAVEWKYSTEKNSYTRANGGSPHIDKNTGKAVESKNIIVIFADESPANDGYEGGHILYDIIGSGKAVVFHNGQAIKGSWNKKTNESLLTVVDETGEAIEMVRGQQFFEILPIGNTVNY